MRSRRANKRFVSSGIGVPKTTSPISQAVVAGNMCFVSGQLPVNGNGLPKKGAFDQESRIALGNLISVLQASGFALKDVIYIDVALLNISDLPMINKLFRKSFDPRRRPARTVYQAAALPLGCRVKFQAIACKD